jgi:hypothetical protein
MKRSIFSNIIKSYPKTPLSMRQVKDHVRPGFPRRVSTISVLLGAFFQERVSIFTVYMMLLQYATITEQNMRINILESSGLAKPEELEVDNAILNDV